MSVMMENLMAKYKGALDNVRFLLYVERMGGPTTLNISFHDNLEIRSVISYSILFSVTSTDSYPVAEIGCKRLWKICLSKAAHVALSSSS